MLLVSIAFSRSDCSLTALNFPMPLSVLYTRPYCPIIVERWPTDRFQEPTFPNKDCEWPRYNGRSRM